MDIVQCWRLPVLMLFVHDFGTQLLQFIDSNDGLLRLCLILYVIESNFKRNKERDNNIYFSNFKVRNNTNLSFFKVPLKASITPRWYSWRTSDKAQDLLAVCLFDPVSRPVTLRPSWRTNIVISQQKLLWEFRNVIIIITLYYDNTDLVYKLIIQGKIQNNNC